MTPMIAGSSGRCTGGFQIGVSPMHVPVTIVTSASIVSSCDVGRRPRRVTSHTSTHDTPAITMSALPGDTQSDHAAVG